MNKKRGRASVGLVNLFRHKGRQALTSSLDLNLKPTIVLAPSLARVAIISRPVSVRRRRVVLVPCWLAVVELRRLATGGRQGRASALVRLSDVRWVGIVGLTTRLDGRRHAV